VIGPLLKLAIRTYRLVISPWIGPACRFEPSCSAYALEAIERHGALRGAILTLGRLIRCRPGGGMGYDPVPVRRSVCRGHAAALPHGH
jgi:putative membrane protein insertion efficiency factor